MGGCIALVFSSTLFMFLFLPFVLFVYFVLLKRRRPRNVFLFVASILFYAWGEPLFVFVMLISLLVTWALGLAAAPREGRAGGGLPLYIGITYHVSLLFVFKYLSFCARELGLLFGTGEPSWSISLPIGISFFTFQLMSYMFDVSRGRSAPQRDPLYVGLYVAFFPQLIAGPIVRYGDIAREITDRRETRADFRDGMEMFVVGLAKKVLLANYLGAAADSVFDMEISRSVATAWLGSIAYTMQIYFDFSGYSSMAIRLGRMFGFHFCENFNYPYISRSVTEFWRRWHISLSSWFRDYVYIPLGGNRVSSAKWARNIFVVWLLTGIWHGANWTFIAWGMFHFALLMAERRLAPRAPRCAPLAHIYAMTAVIVGWTIFRAPNLTSAIGHIGEMIGVGASGLIDDTFVSTLRGCASVLVAGAICSAPVYRAIRSEASRAAICCAAFVICVMQVVSSTYDPFIYFNF